MHDPRHEEPLTDAALDRAIEQGLAVEPSPAFAARVRSRVAFETPSRRPYGWWAIGVAACATPALLLALYVALPGRTDTPDDADRQQAAKVVDAELVAIPAARAEALRAESLQESAVATSRQVERAMAVSPRSARRAVAGPEVAPLRRTIAMPEIVVSQAEVDAVSGLLTMRVLLRASDSSVPRAPAGGLVDRESEIDVTDLAIPPLVIEPLELTARLRGESE